MRGKSVLASLLIAGAVGMASPAHAGGWAAWGSGGGAVHWGGAYRYGGYYRGYPHPYGCCYAGGVAVGAVAGLAVDTAVGMAAASHPAYVVPPPVVYAPPPVVYAPPPVIYAPGYGYVR